MLNCWENTLKLQFDSYVTAVKFATWLVFKTTWLDLIPTADSNTAGISLDSRLKYSIILTGMQKTLQSLGSCAENFLLTQISSILSVNFTRLWHKCQRVFWWASCTSARHAGSFDCLMTSLILITMDNGRGHSAYWQSCKVPKQTHRGIKKGKCML